MTTDRQTDKLRRRSMHLPCGAGLDNRNRNDVEVLATQTCHCHIGCSAGKFTEFFVLNDAADNGAIEWSTVVKLQAGIDAVAAARLMTGVATRG